MIDDQQILEALVWAASLRGVSDPESALDWMAARELIEHDFETGHIEITDKGRQRGSELVEALQRVPAVDQRERTRSILWLAGAALLVWRWRRRRG